MNALQEVMTFKEATDYLGKSPSYLNNYVATEKLEEGVHYRTAGRVKIILRKVVEKIKGGFKVLTTQESLKIVNECVDTEMTEGCHNDYIEDYSGKLEFYLSNVKADSYIGYLKDNYGVDEMDAFTLQQVIIDTIKEKCRAQ